jgi:hypothetical protein
MAKIKMSPLVTAIQGSTDKLLFSSSRGVATVRTKKTPVQPNTQAQLTNQRVMAHAMTELQILGSFIANPWKTYTATLPKTWVNAFLTAVIGLERDGYQAGLTPSLANIAQPVLGALEWPGAGPLSISFTPSPVPAGHSLVLIHRVGDLIDPAMPALYSNTVPAGTPSPIDWSIIDPDGTPSYIFAFLLDSAGLNSGLTRIREVDII